MSEKISYSPLEVDAKKIRELVDKEKVTAKRKLSKQFKII